MAPGLWIILFLCGLASAAETGQPKHLHLSYGESSTEMVIQWSTAVPVKSTVLYGKVGEGFPHSMGAEVDQQFTEANSEGLQFYHRTVLKDLEQGMQYNYQVKTETILNSMKYESAQFSFNTLKAGNQWSPRLLVYGDMGSEGASNTVSMLKAEMDDNWPMAVIHTGDFAYNLHTDGGKNGDQFMDQIEPIAARLPYMTCVGNHESPFDFAHYKNRFHMPGDSENMWYSWDASMVHFIGYSTEVYFSDDGAAAAKQYNWLREDLCKANKNRKERPWIIAYGHRPMYCSNNNDDDCANRQSRVRGALETLFHSHGVDLILEAHEHSYERLWPTYNLTVFAKNYEEPRAPVHLIAGAAGCNIDNGVCWDPILLEGGPWSAFRSVLPTSHGYGRLEIIDSSHLVWEQVFSLTGTVEDTFTLIQHNHGPFISSIMDTCPGGSGEDKPAQRKHSTIVLLGLMIVTAGVLTVMLVLIAFAWWRKKNEKKSDYSHLEQDLELQESES